MGDPGSLLAIVVWLVASAGFAFYVANFGSYNKTYGALGGVIVFLVWLWLTNVAILLGAELNAEHERSRELEGGHTRSGARDSAGAAVRAEGDEAGANRLSRGSSAGRLPTTDRPRGSRPTSASRGSA